MSEPPLSETCVYCGSPDVMDDAWWCEKQACWEAYDREEKNRKDYLPGTHAPYARMGRL